MSIAYILMLELRERPNTSSRCTTNWMSGWDRVSICHGTGGSPPSCRAVRPPLSSAQSAPPCELRIAAGDGHGPRPSRRCKVSSARPQMPPRPNAALVVGRKATPRAACVLRRRRLPAQTAMSSPAPQAPGGEGWPDGRLRRGRRARARAPTPSAGVPSQFTGTVTARL